VPRLRHYDVKEVSRKSACPLLAHVASPTTGLESGGRYSSYSNFGWPADGKFDCAGSRFPI